MYDPTGHQPGAAPSHVLTALRGETKRLDAPAVTGAQVAAPAITDRLTLDVDATAFLDATQAAFKSGGPLYRSDAERAVEPRPSRAPFALLGRTRLYDGAGNLRWECAPGAEQAVPAPAGPLSPAERAQHRAEACLADLAAATHADFSDPAAYAQRMAAANHAAAQALLSAYVLWLARTEAGGLSVPVAPLAALTDAEQGA